MTAALRSVLQQVHDGELGLERELHAVAHRHRTDHEVRHVAVDLARWSLMNREALEPVLQRYGKEAGTDAHAGPGAVRAVREKTSELLGRREAPALLLLRDLRHLHLMAESNSVLWTVLGQAAQGSQDSELLDVVTRCHGRTMRQAVWCTSTLKVLAPQALSAV